MVFNIRLALPRFVTIWNLTNVFGFLKSKPPLTDCDLKTTPHKLALLLCLATGQRDQTIENLNFNYTNIFSDKVVLFVPETLKSIRLSHHLQLIELEAFKDIEFYVVYPLPLYMKISASCVCNQCKHIWFTFN